MKKLNLLMVLRARERPSVLLGYEGFLETIWPQMNGAGVIKEFRKGYFIRRFGSLIQWAFCSR